MVKFADEDNEGDKSSQLYKKGKTLDFDPFRSTSLSIQNESAHRGEPSNLNSLQANSNQEQSSHLGLQTTALPNPVIATKPPRNTQSQRVTNQNKKESYTSLAIFLLISAIFLASIYYFKKH